MSLAPVTETRCDVVILGTGVPSTVLATILAKHGMKVVLVDRTSHPRFAIGESTIGSTTLMLEFLSVRYGIPELMHLTSVDAINENVMPSHGIKSNFGFVYHDAEGRHNAAQSNQAVAVREIHLFRQDIDAYMFQVAAHYGCEVHQNHQVTEMNIASDGVQLLTNRGLRVRAEYLVDGSGYDSIVARQFNLRENPTTTKAHSRGLFTHMIDVKPYDVCQPRRPGEEPPARWHDGTLHHLFDGGWLWVIPFNNIRSSKNRLVSVGLMLDPRKFPATGEAPEAEFRKFIAKYPSIREQFLDAKSVREWVSSGRIQYNSKRSIGDRFCLLSHASGFIDPLFSRGLFNSMQTVNVLANLLIQARKKGDYSAQQFELLEEVQQGLIAFNDQLVNVAFISWRDYHLWNAWFRLWVLTSFYSQFRILRALCKYEESNDTAVLDSLDHYLPGSVTNIPAVMELFRGCASAVEAVERGEQRVADAVQEIYRQLAASRELLPLGFDFLDPSQRFTLPRQPNEVRAAFRAWIDGGMPESVRRECFDYDIERFFQRKKGTMPTTVDNA